MEDCLSPTAQSAIALLLDTQAQRQTGINALWNDVQEIRSQKDKSFYRWPPHINLLFPFLPSSNSSAPVEKTLSVVCAQLPPIVLRFSRFSFFEHRHSCTVFLSPASCPDDGDHAISDRENGHHVLQQLHMRLMKRFPMCDRDFKRSKGLYQPHLTVGQVADKAEAEWLISNLSSRWGEEGYFDIKLVFSGLSWLQRERDGPFAATHNFPFTAKSLLEDNCESFMGPVGDKYGAAQRQTTWNEWTEIGGWRWMESDGSDGGDGSWVKADNINPVTSSQLQPSASLALPVDTVSIVSWNLLFDIPHLTEGIRNDVRLKHINRFLCSIYADVLCLQEVTPRMGDFLRAQQWVRDRYYVTDCGVSKKYKTHPLHGVMVLSRFRIFQVFAPESTPTKRAVIARILLHDTGKNVPNSRQHTATIASVHLTSGASSKGLEFLQRVHKRRKDQLAAVTEFIQQFPNAIIAGDFNCGDDNDLQQMRMRHPSEILAPYCFALPTPTGFDDIAVACKADATVLEDMVTFDPLQNATAHHTCSATKAKSLVARRLDRICIASDVFSPCSCVRIGTDPCFVSKRSGTELFPSDHFGILATVAIGSQQQQPPQLAALARLQALIPSLVPQTWRVVAVGSVALGVADAKSDLDIVCISTLETNAFFAFLRDAIVRWKGDSRGLFVSRTVSDARIPVLKMVVDGVDVDIQHSSLCEDHTLPTTPQRPLRARDIVSLHVRDTLDWQVLSAVLDTITIQQCVGIRGSQRDGASGNSNRAARKRAFISLVRRVKEWAKERQVYGSHGGYLTGAAVNVLCAHAVATLRLEINLRQDQPSRLQEERDNLRSFFELYGAWDWKNIPVVLDIDRSRVPQYFPTVITSSSSSCPAAHMIVLSAFTGASNLMRNATRSSAYHVAQELMTSAMGDEGIDTRQQERQPLQSGLTALLAARPCVAAHCFFDSSSLRGEERQLWSGYCLSRTVRVVVLLEQKLGDSIVIVPRRMRTEGVEFHVFNRSNVHLQIDLVSMERVIRNCFQVQTDERCESERVRSGRVVIRIDDLADERVEKESDKEEGTDSSPSPSLPADGGHRHSQKNSNGKKRFRASNEVLNRIRWDPSLGHHDWIIGWEDRFTGIMEAPLNEFDYDTIPLHRVRIFKRDGEIVWSRTDRIDLIFNE